MGEAMLSDLLDNDDPFSLRAFGVELGAAVETARQNRNAPDLFNQQVKEVEAVLWNLRHWVGDSYAGRLDLERFPETLNAMAVDLIKPTVGDGGDVLILP